MRRADKKYIVITGAAGFIGNCLARHFTHLGHKHIVLVDDFNSQIKLKNWASLTSALFINRDIFFQWLDLNYIDIYYLIHLGARTDTTEINYEIHERLNLNYSKAIWQFCAIKKIPLIYASSAATYGNGEFGYEDDHLIIPLLKPLNPYGLSKNLFDMWVLNQTEQPPSWVGLKFFNVYGPGEYAKGSMASVIFRFFKQIKENGTVNLFKSYQPDFQHGEQLRDFIYVKDIIKVIYWITTSSIHSGIYNLGTGNAKTYLELVDELFASINQNPQIKFIDIPVKIRENYQYYTQANMEKLRAAGYCDDFSSLKEGIHDYVGNYLNVEDAKKKTDDNFILYSESLESDRF